MFKYSLFAKGYPQIGVWLCCCCLRLRRAEDTINPMTKSACRACEHSTCNGCILACSREKRKQIQGQSTGQCTRTSSRETRAIPRRIYDETPSRWICANPKCRASNPGLESFFCDECPGLGEIPCTNPNCLLTLEGGIKDKSAVWIQNRYFQYLGTWDGHTTTVAADGPWDRTPNQDFRAKSSFVGSMPAAKSLKDFKSWGPAVPMKGFWAMTQLWSGPKKDGSEADILPRRHSALVP